MQFPIAIPSLTFRNSLVAGITTRWGRSEKTLVRYLSPVVEERLSTREKRENTEDTDKRKKPVRNHPFSTQKDDTKLEII